MKSTVQEHHTIKSISALMQVLGHPKPRNPLVVLTNYGAIRPELTRAGESFILDFYKISFKTDFRGQVKYGQGYYDFEEGGLAFLAPHQLVTMSGNENSYQGFALYFHPDLIRNYALGKIIGNYGFFSYGVSEALFLSDQEKSVITALFDAIAIELQNNIDQFSQDVIVSQIELLLNHSNRFYNRQFLTRKAVYNDLISKMDLYLTQRFDQQRALLSGIPSVQELSEHLEVSPRYLTDMLKSLTGQSTQQHIHNRLIERAKDILSTSNLTIAEIAYELGFEHPQSFNKLFKQKTNVSPLEFRQSFH